VEGNITRAAAILGIDRRTLQRKLRGYEEEQ
jgi:DNA-binding protein Fis